MAISGIGALAALHAPPIRALAAAGATRGCNCESPTCPTCGQRSGAAADAPPADRLELSAQGQAALQSGAPSRLTPEQQEQVAELRQRDAEVRQHEAAHQAAAGGQARGGASFEYQRGPDGRRYAVGGEVQLDTSGGSEDPGAQIAALERVRAAALAPAQPSGQDRAVAAQASAQIARVRAQRSEQSDDAALAADRRGFRPVRPATADPLGGVVDARA